MGASMGHVDPLKEVNAAEARIRNNISTEDQEAMEYNGNDWSEIVRQREKEIATRASMGGDAQEATESDSPPPDDGDDEKEDKEDE